MAVRRKPKAPVDSENAVIRELEAALRREQQIDGLRELAAIGPVNARRIDD